MSRRMWSFGRKWSHYLKVWVFKLLYQAGYCLLQLKNKRELGNIYFPVISEHRKQSQIGGERSYLHLHFCVVSCFCYEESSSYEFESIAGSSWALQYRVLGISSSAKYKVTVYLVNAVFISKYIKYVIVELIHRL